MEVPCACSPCSMGIPRKCMCCGRNARSVRPMSSGWSRRRPRVHPFRQRPEVHRQGPPALACEAENQDHLHHPGEPLGERFCRILPLPLPGRMTQSGAALDPNRGSRLHRGLPPRIQRRAAAQLARLSFLSTLRRRNTLTNLRLRDGPPSRSVPPPRIANHNQTHHIN